MNNPTRRRKFSRKRPLRVEPLETRRLLAADGFEKGEPPAEVLALVANSSFQTADAGSTRNTAARLGAIDGNVRLGGSLGFFDSSDVLRFSVDRDADVQIVLSGLNRDADLYFFDNSGTLIDQSIRSGRRADGVALSVDAGQYFVGVVAASFGSIRYGLSISTELVPPPAPPSQPPTLAPPVATPVVPDRVTPANPTAAPTTGGSAGDGSAGDVVQPLQDVAYLGGRREFNVNAVGAPEAFAAGYTGQGVTVAIVDSGFDLDHPDLVQNLYVNPGEIPGNGVDDDGNGLVDDVHGYDFVDRDANPNDLNGHGTHVAGTVAAGQNGFGATGIAPDATILPVRVLGQNGSGSDRSVANGIRYAADLGADIINLSLGGGFSRTIQAAISYASTLGSLIVAAAGNESAATPGFPARFSANYAGVISVGASNAAGNVAGFSNDVGNSGAVQVDAPGVGIYSTYLGGRYATLSGTSMASPHVAGIAALALSANPNLTNVQLRDLLVSGTIGRAAGSDAIGLANATTTVAYAAAGLTAAPTASTAAANTTSARGSTFRSSMAPATGGTATSIIASNALASDDADDVLDEFNPAYQLVTSTPATAQTNAATPTSVEQAELDEIFRQYAAEDHDDDAQDEINNLGLLA